MSSNSLLKILKILFIHQKILGLSIYTLHGADIALLLDLSGPSLLLLCKEGQKLLKLILQIMLIDLNFLNSTDCKVSQELSSFLLEPRISKSIKFTKVPELLPLLNNGQLREWKLIKDISSKDLTLLKNGNKTVWMLEPVCVYWLSYQLF